MVRAPFCTRSRPAQTTSRRKSVNKTISALLISLFGSPYTTSVFPLFSTKAPLTARELILTCCAIFCEEQGIKQTDNRKVQIGLWRQQRFVPISEVQFKPHSLHVKSKHPTLYC